MEETSVSKHEVSLCCFDSIQWRDHARTYR